MSDLKQTPPFKPRHSNELYREGKEAGAQEMVGLSEKLKQE